MTIDEKIPECLKTQNYYTNVKIGGTDNPRWVCYLNFNKKEVCPYIKIDNKEQVCERYKNDTTRI